MSTIIGTPRGSKIEFFTSKLLRTLDEDQRLKLARATLLVEGRVKELMTGPRTGRWYVIGKHPTKQQRAMGFSKRMHRASAPGESPAVWSGRLLSSITHKIVPTVGGWISYVGTNVQYAKWLEQGTAKMAPRPAWGRALSQMREQILGVFSKRVTWRT